MGVVPGARSEVPVVSAVMAARNAESTIAAAIRSVLDQDFDQFELLVVDDGSTDRTAAVAASFRDPRIAVHRIRAAGRGAARNEALRHARGRYLAITDADDLSLPRRFDVEVRELDRRVDLHAIGAQMARFGSWGGPTVELRYPVEPAAAAERLARHRMPLAHAATMFRTDTVRALGGYDTECVRCQDFELLLRMPPLSVGGVDDVLVHYRSERSPRLSYAVENALYGRLAVARATAKREGRPPPTLRQFAGPGRRIGWAAFEAARWAALAATARRRRGRRLT
jgi:teichuronic acid biosynthesis glycosyltransferase TuaG